MRKKVLNKIAVMIVAVLILSAFVSGCTGKENEKQPTGASEQVSTANEAQPADQAAEATGQEELPPAPPEG